MKRILSLIVIVLLLLIGSFLPPAIHAGVPSGDTYQKVESRVSTVYINDLFVINRTTIDPLTGERGKYGFDANVVVLPGGTLQVENATLYFLSDVAHRYNLTVEGNLYFYNTTFTIGKGLIGPYYPFSINIKGPSTGSVKIINSDLLYPGWFNVTSKSGNVMIEDTVFDRMPSNPLDNPPSYGPTPYIYHSTVYFYHTEFRHLRKQPSSGSAPIGYVYNNTTIQVTSNGDNVTIGNYKKVVYLQYSRYWSFVILKDLKISLTYTNGSNYDKTSLLQLIYRGRYNEHIVANYTLDGSGKLVQQVSMTDIETVANRTYTADEFVDALSSGEIYVKIQRPKNDTVTIHNLKLFLDIEKNIVVDGIEPYSFNAISSVIYGRDVYVDVDYKPRADLGTTHNMMYVDGSSRLYFLNLTVNDTGTEKRMDTCFLMYDESSEVYILRYAAFHVTFQGKIPIDGLGVYATPNPVDIYGSSNIKSKIVGIIQNYIYATKGVPGMSIGHVTGYQIWDTTLNGTALLPLLSDIVNKSEMPNSKYIGIYNVDVKNDTKTFYSVQIGLEYFPWLMAENNTINYNIPLSKYKDVDLRVSSIVVTTSQPYMVGRDLGIHITVENLGKDAAQGATLTVYINGMSYTTLNLPLIKGKKSVTESLSISGSMFTSPSTYAIGASVSYIWDYNLNNNNATISVPVGVIKVSSVTPVEVIRYSVVNLSVSVESTYSWNNVPLLIILDNNSNILYQKNINLYAGTNVIEFQWDVDNIAAGGHVVIVYVNSIQVGSAGITVKGDIDLQVESVTVTPSEIYLQENVKIDATVINAGKDMPSGAKVYMTVYDPYGALLFNQTFTYPSQAYEVTFLPKDIGKYTLKVGVIVQGDYNPSNNMKVITFTVNPVPFSVGVNLKNEYINGTDIPINITVSSEISAKVWVTLEFPTLNLVLTPTADYPGDIGAGSSHIFHFVLKAKDYAPSMSGSTSVTFGFYVHIKSNRTDDVNYTFGAYNIKVQQRGDIEIVPGTFMAEINGKAVSKAAQDVVVTIKFTLKNVGGMSCNLTYVLKDNNKIILERYIASLAPGKAVAVKYNYSAKNLGKHTLLLTVNPAHNVSEMSYENNNATLTLEVIPPAFEISVVRYSVEHGQTIYEGDTIFLMVKVINKNATESTGKTVYMENVTVTVSLGNLGVFSQMTNKYGVATFKIPAKVKGTYTPVIKTEYHTSVQSFTSTQKVVVKQKPFQIPWLWVIIGVVAAGVGGFFLYGFLAFRKKAKEYMVCGNCGRLVPADADRCPYCGVVFEKEKVKCPECGSLIDEDAKYCPVCGAVFMEEKDPEYKKYSELKSNYERYIEKYKEEAKKYIGDKYTSEEFFEWWKTHPEFISFQEWLKRQGEKIEGETVRCPVCGALNPKGAKICRVCGSPLPQEEEEEEKEEGETKIKPPPISKEEVEKLKRPGVVTVEEWAEKKDLEKKEKEKPEEEESKREQSTTKEEGKEEKKEEKSEEKKPIVKKKVIKKVIALNEEKER